MVKKHFPRIKMVLSAALAAIMVFSMALPIFAVEDGLFSKGTDPEHPAQAAITKVFAMPVHTPAPEAEFIFEFAKVGMNDPLIDDAATIDNMPDISPVIIKFLEGSSHTFISGDTKYLVKESADFIKGIGIGNTTWKNGAGVYRYTVSELQSGIIFVDAGIEEEGYSTAVYAVEIWVDNDPEGVLYPKFVVVKIVEDSEDEYYSEAEVADGKVDPTPGKKGATSTLPSVAENYSQVIFTNTYWKTDGSGAGSPVKSALDIIKKVDGMGADLTMSFVFAVTVSQPSIVPSERIYKAIVLDTAGNNITESVYDGTLTDGYIEFTSGKPLSVSLSDGQRLAFVDLHIGATVEVYEADSDGYVTSYERTFAGSGKYYIEEGDDIGFPRVVKDDGPHYLEAGADHNKVTFTNTRAGATPTGVSVDDLPYIVLIVMAIAGLVIYVVVKFNRKDNYETY